MNKRALQVIAEAVQLALGKRHRDYTSEDYAYDAVKALEELGIIREDPSAFRLGDLQIDYVRRRVTMAGREVDLTTTEYRLLCYLASKVGRIVACDRILENVWGEEYSDGTHMLQVYIARLRKKLGDDSRQYILTKQGLGYLMDGVAEWVGSPRELLQEKRGR